MNQATKSNPFAPTKGRLPALQFMAPDELAIDPAYQRSVEGEDSRRLIANIAREWNWDLCLPLVVSRRDDGGLFVIDGQHRLEAARLRGDIPHLPCVVGNYGDAASEAANFVSLNQRRRPLSKLDLFKASVAAGDEFARAIAAAIETAGLTVAPHMTAAGWKPGMIGNIGGIEAAWRKYGPHIASEALQCLSTAFAGKVLRFAGSIYPGLVAVCLKECAAGRAFDTMRFAAFTAKLGKTGQEMLRREIVLLSADPATSRTEASVKAVVALWEGRAPEQVPPVVAVPRQEVSQPIPRPAGLPRGAAPLDRFDLRAKAKAEFCEQCDRLVTPCEAAECASKWCSLRDAA